MKPEVPVVSLIALPSPWSSPTGLSQDFPLWEPSDGKAVAASLKQGRRQGRPRKLPFGTMGDKLPGEKIVRLSLLGLVAPKAEHSAPEEEQVLRKGST